MNVLKRFFNPIDDDLKEGLDKLIEESSPTNSFFNFLYLSVIICTLGIVIDNVIVVIGGMVVAPLLYPVLSFGLGVVMSDLKAIWRASKTIAQGVFFSIVLATVVGYLFYESLNLSILTRIEPSIEYFFIAFTSGVAASYARVKKDMSASLVGVAVAVSLIPPISVIGIGISLLFPQIILGSLSLFFINLFGIFSGSVLVFSSVGAWRLRKRAEKKIEKEDKELEKEQK